MPNFGLMERIQAMQKPELTPAVYGTEQQPMSYLDMMDKLEILQVEDGYIIGTPSGPSFKLASPVVESPPVPVLRELGASSTRWQRDLGGGEYNNDLRGLQGLELLDRMRRSDGTVRQALRILKTPVLQGKWWIDPADPESKLHRQIADFTSKALFQWQTISWTQILTEALLMADFGYYFFEKVFKIYTWEGRPRVIWQKFAPRSPFDVIQWNYDNHGGPKSVEMESFQGIRNVKIPINKLIVFSLDRETGNVEGISALRPMYKHWYYKENLYKIDAIKAERHGIGVPVIVLPPGFTLADKLLAQELGRNLRTNEQAHIVLPPMWEIGFAELKGQQIDIMNSINHHDNKLLDSVLASFIREQRTQGAEVALDIFMKSSRYIADIIRETINKYAIPELINWNWPNVDIYPELKVRRMGESVDLRTLSFTVRNLIGAKAIEPDDILEEYLREEADMPKKDKRTVRIVETPQAPGGSATPVIPRVGMPRQGAPSTDGPGTGEDRSGG